MVQKRRLWYHGRYEHLQVTHVFTQHWWHLPPVWLVRFSSPDSSSCQPTPCQRKLEPPGRHSQSGCVPNFRAFQAQWWSLSVDSMMVFQASSSPFIWQFGRFSMVFPFFTLKGPWFLFQRFWDTKTGSAGDPKMVACQDQVSQMQGRAPASVTEVLGPTRQATRFFHTMLWEWYGNTKGAFGRRKVRNYTPVDIPIDEGCELRIVLFLSFVSPFPSCQKPLWIPSQCGQNLIMLNGYFAW